MKTDRIVFDTNVIVSALMFPRSAPRQAFNIAYSTGKILVSTVTILELEEVLSRKKFEKYFSIEERIQFVARFFADAEIIEINEKIIACRDRKDDKFLELAVNGKANYIITGDQDLLVLNPFQDIAIISVSDYLSL
ncbi:putative toxin-antitoxin system toxin component, PIN family [Pseudanabaena mucicola]|uniref:Toxin-antitoxin system toxin component, PIN family n=1 Tax=Pseudanabaena mucicola FACHB-723 TaxID=2692860 RepID=A0ABR8A171_9CYAN|nr:putative toxin-antitoxin system toxin component, PIN family [Pseudanabaena mucicola]MBD2189495.1 putative toxin-antitoxin system toxin component, PIN family [Pseudanabaena mucicola FACHB-723]